MPSASAKLEKQASTESSEPIKQGIIIIEHKIRNLEKRKSRLESYRDQQSSGKELNSDQLAAIAKYDEVQQTLEFARDLCKQFNGIANETAKQQKKQARKEALEKAQQELAKVKEILLIQDVLANMGQESIRDDFLAGRNGAVKLTEEDLQHLDDLFTEVSPKRDAEEGCPPFSEQIQKAAEHLIYLAEGKNKEVIGTTYTLLRQKIQEIHTCGYFDSSSATGTAPDTITDAPGVVAPEEEDVEGEEDEPESVPTTTFQSSKAPVAMTQVVSESSEQAQVIIPTPQQPPVSEVISSVMSVASSSFNFLQESELDSPEVVAPTAPPASALPIPSQTFTNQSFVPPPQSYPQQPQSLPQAQPVPQPQPVYAAIPMAGQQPSYVPFTSAPPPQPQHQQAYQPQPQVQPTQQPQPPQPVERVSDWSEASTGGNNVLDSSDWNVQCEAASADNAWQQKHQQTSDSWGAMNDSPGGHHHGNNDGFIMSSSGRGGTGRGRGGRGGGRGAPHRGGRNTSGGGGGGGGFYRNNNTSGGDGGNNNYYQSNGFQNRNMSGDHKRGSSGPRVGPGGPRSDRGGGGGPRGSGGRGGRGSNRQ